MIANLETLLILSHGFAHHCRNNLPLFPLTSNSKPSPSTNSTFPSSKIATNILNTSRKGIPKVAKAP